MHESDEQVRSMHEGFANFNSFWCAQIIIQDASLIAVFLITLSQLSKALWVFSTLMEFYEKALRSA